MGCTSVCVPPPHAKGIDARISDPWDEGMLYYYKVYSTLRVPLHTIPTYLRIYAEVCKQRKCIGCGAWRQPHTRTPRLEIPILLASNFSLYVHTLYHHIHGAPSRDP